MSKLLRAPIQWNFVLKWMLANAVGLTVGQAAGVMGGYLVGALFVQALGEAGALLAIAVVGAITGALLGLSQRYVMQQELDLDRQWILLSGVGWAIGYPAAMWLVSAAGPTLDAATSALLYWLLIGASIGLAQWWIMRRMAQRAEWWAAANMVGWLLGPQLAALGIAAAASLGLNPDDSIGALIAFALIGAAVGVFTGLALNWLRQHPVEVEE
jgi:hypothetical protein